MFILFLISLLTSGRNKTWAIHSQLLSHLWLQHIGCRMLSQRKISDYASQVLLWNVWSLALFSCPTKLAAQSWLKIWRLHSDNINMPQWALSTKSRLTAPFHNPESQHTEIRVAKPHHSAVVSSKHWLLCLHKHLYLLQLLTSNL